MSTTIISKYKNSDWLIIDSITVVNSLYGYGVALFLMDFPVFLGITTSRIGFIFMVFGAIMYSKNNKINIALNSPSKNLLRALLVSLFSVLISTVFHLSSLIPFVTWLFTFISFLLLLLFLSNPDNFKVILNKASSLSFLFLLILVGFSIYSFGFFAFESMIMRFEVNEWGPGLSRIINGLTFANVLILSQCYISESRKRGLLLSFSLLLSFWFVFSTQSRQGIILLVILIFSSIWIFYPNFKFKKSFLLVTICTVLFLLSKIVTSEVFQQRFIERTYNQVENDEGSTAMRAYYYEMGIKLFQENLFLGIGPDNFVNKVGGDAHSGYLLEISEIGILACLSFVFVFFSVFKRLLLVFKYKNHVPIIGLILVILLAPFFNSIYRSPMFWSVLLVVVNINYRK